LWWVVWGWMALAVGGATCVAMMATFHISALVGVGSGVWIDEEWPEFMDEPWKSDSLNDLWGKRYHQVRPARSPSIANGQRLRLIM
jgi:hypothetical protein